MWDALCWLARRQGYAVELEHGPPADGTVFWAARRIRIPPGLSGEQAVWALAHQLGHVLLHHDPGYPPGTTTSGCAGLRKAEADSVAWITCARHGITPAGGLPYPASWAGTDPRAQPAAAILAAGHRITTAATRITRHTDRILHGDDPAPPSRPGPAAQAARPARPARRRHPQAAPRPPSPPPAATRTRRPIRRILADAHAFYTGQLAGSWAPGYLHARGITAAAIQDWHIGYAPAGWTTLTSHLRRLGHHDDAIQAAGLATRSSRGTLIDRFRDRVMLPVHDAAGMLAGFTGRAHPDAGPDAPKYLNSPETAAYKKSHLLFGLHQARPALARGAIPVIVEGAVRRHRRHHRRPRPSRRARPLRHRPDQPASRPAQPGRRPAPHRNPRRVRLRHRRTQGRHPRPRHPPPAHRQTPVSRCSTARTPPRSCNGTARPRCAPSSASTASRCPPCSSTPASSNGDGAWTTPSGPLLAMRSTASLIASLLPDDTASQIRDITAGRELQTTDDLLRPVDNPEIPQIARILPADTSYQIVRAAGKLGFDCTDVLAEVANATTRNSRFRRTPAPRTAQ